jgi:hypothetical protein
MGMGIFLSVIMVLVIFNFGYWAIYPTTMTFIGLSALTAFVTTGLAIGVISGISAFTVAISDTAQKIIFVIVLLVNILFQITLPLGESFDFPIGLGLLTNVFNVFASSDAMLIGYIITTILGVLAMVSGLQMAVGAGDG